MKTLEHTIGNTPLVKLQRMGPDNGSEIWVKLEGNNPAGSVKDRAALSMIVEAEKRGETVKPAEKVAEPQPVYKVRTTKNVSIKTVAKTASWRLESKEDVDKYLAALRENLLKEMDEDTIVNIEL